MPVYSPCQRPVPAPTHVLWQTGKESVVNGCFMMSYALLVAGYNSDHKLNTITLKQKQKKHPSTDGPVCDSLHGCSSQYKINYIGANKVCSNNKLGPNSGVICSFPPLSCDWWWFSEKLKMASDWYPSSRRIVELVNNKQQMERTHEHNITQPRRSASDWWLSRVGDWPKENAATWSAISLLYTELDKQHSLTFLSGVPATDCLRLHRLISQYVEKILHPALKILYLENKGLTILHYLVWQQLGAFKKKKGFRGMLKYLQNNRKISI